MTTPTTTEDINRSLLEKTSDEFYVKFLNIENNRANILGRQVYSFDRPTISFNTFDTRFRNERMVSNSTLVFQQFNVVFRDDDKNLTNKVLYEQLYRQAGNVPTARNNKTLDKAKFDMKVEVFNSQKTVIESFTVKGCFIVGISHSESIMASGSVPNRITVTFNCDTVDYTFVDDYVLGNNLNS